MFLQDITLGQYFAVDSPIHRLDPRTKFLGILSLMWWTLWLEHWYALGVGGLVVVGVTVLAQLPVRLVLRNLRPFIWLFLLTLIFQLVQPLGVRVWTLPWLRVPIYQDAILLGLLYACRLALLILMAALLTLTTSPIELTDGLNKFLQPLHRFGVPTYDLIMMMTLALRFIPTLIQEADRIQKAQMSRGANFEGNIWQRLKQLLPLLLPLFIAAFRRADELALAMDARCYNSGAGRTSFQALNLKIADYGGLTLAGGLFIASLALRFIFS